MTEHCIDICMYCPREKKCTAYSCNMNDELEEEVVGRLMDYEDRLIPQLIEEWMKENKIVKQE